MGVKQVVMARLETASPMDSVSDFCKGFIADCKKNPSMSKAFDAAWTAEEDVSTKLKKVLSKYCDSFED